MTRSETFQPPFAFARGLAISLGFFTLLNLLGDLKTPGFDANAWWINVDFLPHTWQVVLLTTSGVVLLVHGLHPFASALGQLLTRGVILLLAFITALNAIQFFVLVRSGEITPGFYVPLSAMLCVLLLSLLRSTRPAYPVQFRHIVAILFTMFLCAILFPLAQMVCFGKTDYRRQADVIVVFGARAYADGSLSSALEDRVRTGCDLYRAGLAPFILMTGGPADGSVHETEAMRARALQLGVPDDAILLDSEGLNTDASVKNTALIFAERKMPRILAVSHFYHLPRIKMTYQRASATATAQGQPSFATYTVPAQETYTLRSLPQYMLREIIALWAYYLRPLTHSP